MEKQKRGRSKLIIIILLVIIVVVVAVSAYFIISGKKMIDTTKKFKADDEYTILLEEFVTNLQNENRGKNYLKIQVALMYDDKKATKTIESNINKIRDIVLNNLREKSSDEILNVKNTPKLKKQILKDLNSSIGDKVIKEIYFTNLVVQ